MFIDFSVLFSYFFWLSLFGFLVGYICAGDYFSTWSARLLVLFWFVMLSFFVFWRVGELVSLWGSLYELASLRLLLWSRY